MREKDEDMLIALYITGEGKTGFDEAHMKKCFQILELMKGVREELKKRQLEEKKIEYTGGMRNKDQEREWRKLVQNFVQAILNAANKIERERRCKSTTSKQGTASKR